MKKFEICFSFPDDDTQYLIPELLDKQEPEDTKAFSPSSCLNFEYHYPVLPEGLLPRFIVRTHVLSEGLPRWRTGVILKFEANRALVKANVHEKKVSISIDGPTSSRDRLLAVIRSDFERIHRDIFKSPPVEMVSLPEYPHVVVPYRELQIMEEQGEKELKKVVGEQILNLDVQRLLNGVDLQGTARRERTSRRPTGRRPQFNYVTMMVAVPMRLFISYTHKDERFRNELETHLKLLQRQRLIET
jgi:internalin A